MTTCENGHIILSLKPCPACLHDAITIIEYFAPENKNRGKALNLPKMVRRGI